MNQPVYVVFSPETGEPQQVDGQQVREILDHCREWIGIIQVYPETDIWRVEIPRGICDLHFVKPNHWTLHNWMD